MEELDVFYAGPDAFTPRAAWVLETLLAPLGRRPALQRDPAAGPRCAFAYAPAPLAGVPTIPCSPAATNLLTAGRGLPAGSFRTVEGPAGTLEGAFPADEGDAGEAFAVPFDLVASAFVLLSCWDEHTCPTRDRFGRLPYEASVFAHEPALDVTEPAVDGYVAALRALLAPRLAELGGAPLADPGWMWRAGAVQGDGAAGGSAPGFAVALTHDIDNLWRWTARGFAATFYRAARAGLRRDRTALTRELGDLREWLTVHLPGRSDPHWTFPVILEGEDARGVASTFFVIASHSDRQDGNQPRTYRRRIPAALDLVRRAGREVGLHGNDRDRRGVTPLTADVDDLERRARTAVEGVRYHYLRCLYHETLPLVEAAGIAYDSSLAFAEHEGFRCGVSFPFRPYSLAEERPLDLLEVPLAVMDTSLHQPQYRALDAEAAERAALDVLDGVRRGGGGAALLWHNVRFDPRAAQGYDRVYWRLLDWVREQGGLATSAGELARRWRAATGLPAPERRDDTTKRRAAAGPGRAASPAAPRRGPAAAPVRVIHLSVVHKPDDPRIHERECRTLAEAGYDVTYVVPGADGRHDEHGVLRAPLPVRGRATRWLSAGAIVRELRARRPHVVHVHDPELLSLFPAIRRVVPRLVYDMHEYVPEQVAAKHYIPAAARPHAGRTAAVAQRGLAALGDGVVVVTGEQLRALGARPTLRVVLPNHPRLSRFLAAEPLARLAADPRLKLIYVGSLSRNRGCGVMLDVMERLAPDEAVLYLGGTFASPDMEAETRRRMAVGLADRVELLGRVPPSELPAYLAAADVVWVPSVPSTQYSHPTVPTKLFEGMAVGLAALVSDLPGRGELVRAEGCGIAVPTGVDGHVAGVRRLLADRDGLRDMGARGREAVAREYSWESREGDLVAFYAQVCRDLPGPGRD